MKDYASSAGRINVRKSEGFMRFGIIGGTGFYQAGEGETRVIATPYGEAEVDILKLGGEEVAFLPRHGKRHSIAPHRINYRANIAALSRLGVENILATATVGSLNLELEPGQLALLTQFLDFTWGRESTFIEENTVKHVDVTEPYCPSLRSALLRAGIPQGVTLRSQATYVCTQGPRFETPAEIEMFRRLGGDLVGMTGVPEVVLAREAGLCYTAVALITNLAAGLTKGEPLSHENFSELSKKQMAFVRDLFFSVIPNYATTDCSCRHLLK
jgi:5'-methylthioadenosine phosphorylase